MNETYVVHITQQCNCDCVYCYEENKETTYSWEEIQYLLDQIVAHTDESFAIEFLGGEPCLRTDLIRKVVEYLPRVRNFIITTNGTIVDDDLIDLLLNDSRVEWSASIDGHAFANMLRVFKNGKNTYQTIIDNYRRLREAGVCNEQLFFHMTMHEYNVGYLRESVHHLYEIGFRGGVAGIIESTMAIDEAFCEEYKRQMKLLTHDMHRGMLKGFSLHEFNSINPKEDRRTYIYNEEGKIIGESYGRIPEDVTQQKVKGLYAETPGGHPVISDLIYNTRKEVLDYFQQFYRVFGCGTGRNASRLLREVLAEKFPNIPVIHEKDVDQIIPWEFSEKHLDRLLLLDGHVVQNSILPYVPALLGNPSFIFYCIQRDRDEYIDSFLTSRSFSPDRSWLKMETPILYPKYGDIPITEGLGRYWDEYYAQAEVYSRQNENFKLIPFEEFINTPAAIKIANKALNEDRNQRPCACRKGTSAQKN